MPLEITLHTDLAIESTNDYYAHQLKHYEAHREEEDYPQLWEEIHKYWTENIAGTKDMSSKAMVGQVMSCRDIFTWAMTIFSSSCLFFRLNLTQVQTWCNVEGIHVFGCVIYSGNDEATCQAQGIFAGSTLFMELASERQTDVAKLLDCLTTVVK